MRSMLTAFRLSQDEDTKEMFRTKYFYYAELIAHVEHYPYDTFDLQFPGPKCYVYFTDGRVVIFLEKAETIAAIVNGMQLANATGRTSLINQS